MLSRTVKSHLLKMSLPYQSLLERYYCLQIGTLTNCVMEFVDDDSLEEVDNQCCICYQPITPHSPKSGQLQPCNHHMHGECILQWMVKKRNSCQTPRCPMCRSWIEMYECNQPSPISYKNFGCVSLQNYKFETLASHLYAASLQTNKDDRYIISIRNTKLLKQVLNDNNASTESVESVESAESYSTASVDWDAFFLRMSLRHTRRAGSHSRCTLL